VASLLLAEGKHAILISQDIHVFLNKSDLPSAPAWQEAMQLADLPTEFDAAFDPLRSCGFVACKFNNSGTGFEYLLSSQEDVASAYPALKHLVRTYDSTVTFTWGHDRNECAVAMISAAILTTLCSGMMYDPQDDLQFIGTRAVDYVRKLITEISM